jgi:hypothetical protein
MSMKKTRLLLVFVALSIATFNASAAGSCAPLVATKVTQAPYSGLNTILSSCLVNLTAKLIAVKDQATYAPLLTESIACASHVLPAGHGRTVITLPDGTVVVDTSKGPANIFANFAAKKINENHNSRVAILDAQLYECGIGVETKRSTTDGVVENYVARRLGNYLDSSGTARLSQK